MKTICLLLFTLACAIFAHTHKEVLRKNIHAKYRYSVQLDSNYTLLWTLSNNNRSINFAIDCRTTGWVGVGFSLHGKMPTSDFFMTYIDSKGKIHASDRYAFSRSEPQTDEELGGTNDFKLIRSREENGRYLVEFSRDVVTKDRFDVPIQIEGHTNIIWAYSFTKPTNLGDPLRMHNRFGSTEVVFGQPSREEPLPDKDIVKTTIQVQNHKLTREHTQYICKNFKYSELGLDIESHAVRHAPIIDNAQVLHHMIIYECAHEVNTSAPIFECMDDMPKCNMVFGWAVGSKAFSTPKEAGFRIAGKRYDNFVLQIHYDNPDTIPGHVDSSGMMIYSTKHFRRYDAGVLTLGVPMGQIRIPPKKPHSSISNLCQNTCSKDKFYIFGYSFHMHLIGYDIETRLFRNGRENILIENRDFHFDRQETVAVKNYIEVQKDDFFFTKCVYNSMNRTEITKGGYPSREEMCYNFISFYPKSHGPAHCYGRNCRLFD